MAVQLKLDKVEGLRLRQQTQVEDVKKVKDVETRVKVWRFDGQDVPPDRDPRTQEPLPKFTAHVAYGLKNLVFEKKGQPITVNFRNSSVRNQLRIRQQTKDKAGAWQNSGDTYLAANTFGGVFVGDLHRAIVDEMPT